MSDQWLSRLITENAQDRYKLTMKLSRMDMKYTQPSDEARSKIRPCYSEDSGNLIATSHVIATHFKTVAAANNYRKD